MEKTFLAGQSTQTIGGKLLHIWPHGATSGCNFQGGSENTASFPMPVPPHHVHCFYIILGHHTNKNVHAKCQSRITTRKQFSMKTKLHHCPTQKTTLSALSIVLTILLQVNTGCP